MSSDVEPSPPKKRSLDEVDDTPLDGEASLRDSKRVRTDQPASAEPEPQGQEPSGELSPGAEEGEIEEDEEPQDDARKGSVSISTPSNGDTAIAPPFELPSLSERREGSWLERFKEWTRAFQDTNSKLTHAITPDLVQLAYVEFIDSISGLKPKKRKSAKQASKEIEKTGELAALLSTIQPTPASKPSPVVQPRARSVSKGSRKGKSSRASSVSEDEAATRANEHASESEAEYEPVLSKVEQPDKAAPSANEWAQLLDDSAQTGQPEVTYNEPIMTKRNVPTGDTALEQQRKYFPTAGDPTKMCLLCGRETHLAPYCPTLICSFCGSLEHSDLSCPSRVRCDKCRQLGHRSFQCTEKLSLTSGEGLACSVCNATDHLEKECTMVWRSFHPETGPIKKVDWILATCALCGSNQHFSLDCKRNQGLVSNPTWSVKNRDEYIDAACGVSSIEGASGGQSNAGNARAPDHKIRGHATRTTHVHYSESDDSDVDFLGHRPVQKRTQVGHIRMASNIQMPGNAGTRARNEQWDPRTQPPLPPGPPPPGPPSRQESFGHAPGTTSGSRPLGPPPSLPMKPPPVRGYQNVPPPPGQQDSGGRPGGKSSRGHRGGRSGVRGGGGRGGRGGGGRGRGRGK
ncbi:hypothetical protein BGZ63DRAFT_354933 [Mariannaea sp. PMI_226]|nr:hypothetical protein BGZ63DRAFT_354933 [Mariannaea sp. PMI_226]